jgi:DNA-binding response OmpR family regulator
MSVLSSAGSSKKDVVDGYPGELDDSAARILVVENEKDHQERIVEVLNDYKYPVTGVSCKIFVATTIEEAYSFLDRDEIDVYVVDLKMTSANSTELGVKFIRNAVAKSNAGIIVCSTVHPERAALKLLELGADDYIWKVQPFWNSPPFRDEDFPSQLKGRITALWRRIQLVRPQTSHLYAHVNRTFAVGEWRFVVGNKKLTTADDRSVRLSSTEHALLRYACVIEDHIVEAEKFSEDALRKDYKSDFRLDNLVYRLKAKLGHTVDWESIGARTYRLNTVRELKPTK